MSLDAQLPSAPVSRGGSFRYSGVELLVSLLLFFAMAPFIEQLPGGQWIDASLLSVVMLSSVPAVGGRKPTLLIAMLLVSIVLTLRWLWQLQPDLLPQAAPLGAMTVFFLFVVAHLLRSVLRARRVDADVLCAGVSGYLIMGLLWMPVYVLVAELSPDAFAFNVGAESSREMDGFNALYYSFVTLCTVGFGDITPVSSAARMLTVLEAVCGLFYIAVLISRLVAVYSEQSRAES